MSISKAVAQAWSNPEFKTKLVSDPRAALADCGVEVPEGINVKVVENTVDTRHLVLPAKPANAGEMSIDELERLSGGMPGVSDVPTYC